MPRTVDFDNYNEDAAKEAYAAVFEKTGGERYIPEDDDEEMWDLWFDVYEENGGKVIYTEPKGKKPATVTEKCTPSTTVAPTKPASSGRPLPQPPSQKPPPLKLEIIELTCLTDHGLMRDNDADWDNTGNLFAKPDWTPSKSNPVSHSLNKKMTVQLVIRATGTGTETGKIGGKFGDTIAFPAQDVTFSPGRNEITLTSGSNIGKKPTITTLKLDWLVKTDRRTKGETIGTTTNEVYITFSDPVPRIMEPDDGVTIKRMKTAIDTIKSSNEEDPQKIVKYLMGLFPHYCLEANPAVPKKYGHPYYSNPKAGAWPMAQYRKYTAECQAICRFVRGILDQVGCPGVVEPVVVWCDPDLTAKEAPYGQGGLRFKMKTVVKEILIDEQVIVEKEQGALDWLAGKPKEKVVQIVKKKVTKNETWSAFLTTGAAIVGRDASGSGLNLYEACLKFTHDGKTKYYGGGAGSFDTKEQVVRAFHSLIWVHQVPQDENDRFSPMVPICKEIVQTF